LKSGDVHGIRRALCRLPLQHEENRLRLRRSARAEHKHLLLMIALWQLIFGALVLAAP
jgi:hypothetical protein